MASSALRRKDTTRGPPLRILSLDGGGVRGYSMLIILQELMHRTFVEIEGRAPKRHEIPKPCEHFDLIVGTGTGGLIALMLGRLRLDVDTCKDVYVRMTRKVFETDKTVLGIPYRGTMFKASKLEEAIQECVAEHTVYEDEGNDLLSLATPIGSAADQRPRRGSDARRHSSLGARPGPMSALGRGNPDAMLYDQREERTKTAVTAMLRVREPHSASTVLLRSYDSRKEPAPDVNCTIWEAGRATCATGLAFKPIQIGQSIYHDDGEGTYNPSPQVLHEAVVNEWPGRQVGVFVSIGTGKRPSDANGANQQHLWWESLAGGAMGEFAEARRKLFQKIEGCEEIHQDMVHKHLPGRGVDPGLYFRLNVEVGVGDFKMNEWNRLSEISTGTRVYLGKPHVETINQEAASRLAQIHFGKRRREDVISRGSFDSKPESWDRASIAELGPETTHAGPVELPAELARSPPRAIRINQTSSPVPIQTGTSPPVPGKYRVAPAEAARTEGAQASQTLPSRSSQDARRSSGTSPRHPPGPPPPPPPPAPASGQYVPNEEDRLPHAPEPYRRPPGVPPLPPKEPLTDEEEDDTQEDLHPRPLSVNHNVLKAPYPDADGPPPPVNLARKPLGRRS